MELALRIYAQLADMVRGMSPRVRVAGAAAVVLVLAGVLLLGRRELAGGSTYLLGGQSFSVDEITAMQGAFGKAQLSDFAVEGDRIRIPQAKQAAYLAALADKHALPRSLNDVFAEGSEKSTWWTSRQQQVEHARTTKKLTLMYILRSIDGVESADVDFDKEESRGLKPKSIATALVAIKLRGGRPLTDEMATYFQSIAGASLGMAPHDVTVVDKNSAFVTGGHATGAGSVAEEYRNLKRKYQADYEATIYRALAFVPGATVSAEVELDTDALPGPAGGAQGADGPGGANRPAQLGATREPRLAFHAATSMTRTGEASSNHHARAGQAGMLPRRVRVAVGVPTSHFESLWRQSHLADDMAASTPTAEELQAIENAEIARIRRCVTGLIPTGAASEAEQLVIITPYVHTALPVEVQRGRGAMVIAWLVSSGPWIAGVMVLVVSLAVVRIALRLFLPPVADAKLGCDQAAHAVPPAPHFAAPRTDGTPRVPSGRTLREELADMVREDPAAAANVLRSWMGNTN